MPSAGPDFTRLHQLLQNLKSVQDKLVRGPRQIKARQKKIVAANAVLVDKEGELKSLRAESDRKSLDLRSKEAHLLEFKRKLNGAASNREYEIITGQIDADIAAKAVLEDEILEYLDRVDTLQDEVEAAKKKIADLEIETQKFADDFKQRAAGMQQEEAELNVKAKEAQKVIPSEVREQFQRMVVAYGPEAMADCTDGVCSNCFVQMTPQSKVLLNNGNSLFCGSCGRLNYLANE